MRPLLVLLLLPAPAHAGERLPQSTLPRLPQSTLDCGCSLGLSCVCDKGACQCEGCPAACSCHAKGYDTCSCSRGGMCICDQPGGCPCPAPAGSYWNHVAGCPDQIALHAPGGRQIGNYRYSDGTWHRRVAAGRWRQGGTPPVSLPARAAAPAPQFFAPAPTFFGGGGGRRGGGC